MSGTRIQTPQGLQCIEEIQPGDVVGTRPETALHDRPPVAGRVRQTYVTHPDVLVHVTYRTSDCDATLTCTFYHPFYSVDRERFVYAGDLGNGELLSRVDNELISVVHVAVEEAAASEPITTYILEVDQTHNYFVTDAGLWVHNLDNRA